MKPRLSPFERWINLPAGLVAVTGILFALALLLLLSFRQNDGQILAWAFTTDNYTALIQDRLFFRILVRSLIIAGLASLATVLLAYPVAYYITFRAGERRGLWLILVTLPFWTSYLLRVFAWKTILGYNGILNSAFVALHIPGAPFESLLYNPGAVVVTLAHAYAAFAILPIFVSLSAIDTRLNEAGLDLGARPRTVFRRIILPLSFPGIAAAFILVFVPTLGDYATPLLVGGNSSLMVGNLIEDQFTSLDDWPGGSAMAVSLIVILTIAFFLGRSLWRGWRRRQMRAFA
jgi:spermidine/putrescine transport system permease protein